MRILLTSINHGGILDMITGPLVRLLILHSFEHSECLFPGEQWWSRDGAVLRVPTSYQFGPGLKPDVYAICGLAFVVGL